MAFDWPGNIRQLENTVERALASSPGRSQIDVSVLPPDVRGNRPEGGQRDRAARTGRTSNASWQPSSACTSRRRCRGPSRTAVAPPTCCA